MPASVPIATLNEPEDCLYIACAPSPTLLPPVVTLKALKPTAVLLLPFVLVSDAVSAVAPSAVFCEPEVIPAPALLPTAVFDCPLLVNNKAFVPKALFEPLLVLIAAPAIYPNAVLSGEVVRVLSAAYPPAVFLAPEVFAVSALYPTAVLKPALEIVALPVSAR